MRMTREAPPELDFSLPGPYASTSATVRPASRRRSAVQLPNTPAPITAQSNKLRAPSGGHRARVCELRRGDIFHRLSQRLQDGHLMVRRPARDAPREHFAQLARDVAGTEVAFLDGDHKVSRLF